MAARPSTTIHVDGESIAIPGHRTTGAALLELAPQAQNIWLDVLDAQDRSIAPDEELSLQPEMRFFTDRPRGIFVDKVAYTVRAGQVSESQLRNLPTPPIPDGHGIWKDVPDDLDDALDPGEFVKINEGDRFFSKELPTTRIFINGRPRTVAHRRVSYDQLVQLAFPDGPAGENVTYTITYTRAAGSKAEGALAAGGFIRVKEGTRINVTPTDKS